MAIDRVVDTVSQTLTRAASRRGSLGIAFSLLAALLPCNERVSRAKRNRKKQRKKRTKRKPPRPPTSPPCSECTREFASGDDQTWCEIVCQQCDGDDPREFCIVEKLDPLAPTKVAVCCAEGLECCGNTCCGPDRATPSRRCCDGQCVDTDSDVLNCSQCGKRCPAGWECDGGECVCRRNCPCPAGRVSCNGQCCPPDSWCFDERQCCPDTYLPPDRVYTPSCASIYPEDQCIPDSSFVCCEGFGCFVGATDPTDWVCCGTAAIPIHQRTCVRSNMSCLPGRAQYAPLATHTYGE